MSQLYLPTDLEAEIPANHVVRVVNEAVDRLSDAIFDSAYPGGGRPSYHPKMLTKVIIYAYTQRIYSSRQIANVFVQEIVSHCDHRKVSHLPALWGCSRFQFRFQLTRAWVRCGQGTAGARLR